MEVKVINKSKHNLPKYETSGAAGMDLKADTDEPIVMNPMERHIFPTGLYIQLPIGYEAQIRPRSGLAIKSGVTVINSPGTVDPDYTGQVMVGLINLSNDKVVINPGDRIAQMVIAKYEQTTWVEVKELDKTERGNGGLGSTGK